MRRKFRVLAATDGSAPARAALKTAAAFPWPEPSSVRGVIALGGYPRLLPTLRPTAVRKLYAEFEPTKRLLARRWPDASVVALHEPPAQAIFSEARRFGAQAIAVGWRGQGALRRLLAGSVSRELAARSRVPVLVARRASERIRRVVVGIDGSAAANRALRFASRLQPRPGSRALVVSVIEPLYTPSTTGLPSAIGFALRADVARLKLETAAKARRRSKAAAALLARAGWHASARVQRGAPLETLLTFAGARDDTVLVIGARAASGLRRLLLGSVAEGALDHARVPVLIVP